VLCVYHDFTMASMRILPCAEVFIKSHKSFAGSASLCEDAPARRSSRSETAPFEYCNLGYCVSVIGVKERF